MRLRLTLALLVIAFGLMSASPAQARSAPALVRFHYGSLGDVDRSRSAEHSVAVLSTFDLVVTSEPGEMSASARGVLSRLLAAGVQVYGYTHIAVTLSPMTIEAIQTEIDRCAEAGMTGVFLDTAGYDYEVSRARLNAVVEYAHSRGLKVMANAWHPEDLLEDLVHPSLNPGAQPSALGQGDWILLESFYRRSDDLLAGEPEGGFATVMERYQRAVSMAAARGVQVAGLAYHRTGQPYTDTADRERSYLLAMLLGLQGWSYGLSDSNDQVPWTGAPIALPEWLPQPEPLRRATWHPLRWERRFGEYLFWVEANDRPAVRSAGWEHRPRPLRWRLLLLPF